MLFITLLGFILLLGLLSVQVGWFAMTVTNKFWDYSRALQTSNDIVLADIEFTFLVRLAATSGDERWIEEYGARLPAAMERIADMVAQAPPDPAKRYRDATQPHIATIAALDQQVFDLVRQGRISKAQAIVDGPGYKDADRALGKAHRTLLQAIVNDIRKEVGEELTRASVAGALTILSGLAMIVTLVLRQVRRSERTRQAMEGELRWLASTDGLTRIANRTEFEAALEACVDAAGHAQTSLGPPAHSPGEANSEVAAEPHVYAALIAIDLNGFKAVNDQYGHSVGDAVLECVAQRLARTFERDFVARIGGDEFMVLTRCEQRSLSDLREDVETALAAVAAPITLEDATIVMRLSVGICSITAGCSEECVRKGADLALYAAKERKSEERFPVRVYGREMDAQYRRSVALRDKLRAALACDEFEPYFQPIMDLRTSEPVGVEVLARWRSHDGDVLPPARFVDELTRMGSIEALTYVMLEKSCRIARTWDAPLILSLNVPPTQLTQTFADRLSASLKDNNYPPDRLRIEILENALATDDPDIYGVLEKLRRLGVRLALDDFGVGYSSISELSLLPVDTLKIDRSFVLAMTPGGAPSVRGRRIEEFEARAVVRAAIDLGAAFGLSVVAEGAESEEHVAALRALGCGFAQGYHYAQPLCAQDFSTFLRERCKGNSPPACAELGAPQCDAAGPRPLATLSSVA